VNSLPTTLDLLKAELVMANRILLSHGVVDAFGHVSARHPELPGHFLMSRRVAPGLVQVRDILTYDAEGEPVDGQGRTVYLERFIHSALYAARPDVQAVVHSHSPGAVAFSVVDQPLRPVCHLCGFLGGGAPVFEMRERFGHATDLMIDSPERAAALAARLGGAAVVLMRGHGSTTVGPTLPRAVYRAVYTETNARLQREAMALGAVTYLSPQEAEATERLGDVGVERTWAFWKQQLPPEYESQETSP